MKKRPATPRRLSFETFSIGEKDHPAFKAAMMEAARAGVDAFPTTLERIKEQLRRHDPVGIMASLAGYSLLTSVGQDGAKSKPPTDIMQHHAELLQAIILTIPPDEWGSAPVTPAVMQTVSDELPKLADTFLFQRMLDAEKTSDEQERLVLSLQERMRLHTMGVRNWAHFGAVVRISRELYSGIDASFTAHYGFSCTDLIDVALCVVNEFERRQKQHWDTRRKVMLGKRPRDIFQLYYKHVPGLVGNADDLLASMQGINRDGARAVVMGHYDLRLAELSTFSANDVARLSGRSAPMPPPCSSPICCAFTTSSISRFSFFTISRSACIFRRASSSSATSLIFSASIWRTDSTSRCPTRTCCSRPRARPGRSTVITTPRMQASACCLK
jgi:hypothetical protein